MAVSETPRHKLKRYSAGTDPHPTRLVFNGEVDKLEALPAIKQGSTGSRPLSGVGKVLYWDEAVKRFVYDDGSAWQDVAPIGVVAPKGLAVAGPADEGSSVRAARADHVHPLSLATKTAHGAMSSADKTKLDSTLTETELNAAFVGRKSAAAQELATLGSTLATGAGWSLGVGWTGTFAAGFTHVAGATASLTWTPASPLAAGTYIVEWGWTGPAGAHQDVYSGYDVTLGAGSAGIIYQGAAPDNASYSRAIKTAAGGTLSFTPWTMFEGRIHSVTVRLVQAAAAVPPSSWTDAAGFRTAELRFGQSVLDSIYFGKDSGKFNISGRRNVAMGSYSMADNVSGFFNVAFGFSALQKNVNGTRNVAIGYNALTANISGDRNVGIGPFALTRLTTGQRNLAIGVDNLWRLETGNDNIGLGYLALTELRYSSENIAMGKHAMRHTHGASDGSTTNNIAIGTEALGYILGIGHIGIGRRAMAAQVSGTGNVGIGDYALELSNADQQVAVGELALRYFTGGRNTGIGHNAMRGVSGSSTGTRNVAVGDNAAIDLTMGSNNTVIGGSAGVGLTDQTGNILIGFAATAIAGRSNFLNIGSLLYGDLAAENIGFGVQTPTARLHLRANRSTQGGATMKFSGGPLLTVPENDALEYDGTDIYITAGGVRHRLTKTAV